MYLIYIIKLMILACNIIRIQCGDNMELSDKRTCANKECSVPISEGRTLMKFPSPTPGVLSFGSNQKVTIYSKDAGKNVNLWGAEINGKRGYVPRNLIKEIKIFNKGPLAFLENVEGSSTDKETPIIKPDAVKDLFEVIDGTTVYSGGSDDVIQVTEAVTESILSLAPSPDESDSDKIDFSGYLSDSIKLPEILNSVTPPAMIVENEDSIGQKEGDEINSEELHNFEETLEEPSDEDGDDFVSESENVLEKELENEESNHITETIDKEIELKKTADQLLNVIIHEDGFVLPNEESEENNDSIEQQSTPFLSPESSFSELFNTPNSLKPENDSKLDPPLSSERHKTESVQEPKENPETERTFTENPMEHEFSKQNGSFIQQEEVDTENYGLNTIELSNDDVLYLEVNENNEMNVEETAPTAEIEKSENELFKDNQTAEDTFINTKDNDNIFSTELYEKMLNVEEAVATAGTEKSDNEINANIFNDDQTAEDSEDNIENMKLDDNLKNEIRDVKVEEGSEQVPSEGFFGKLFSKLFGGSTEDQTNLSNSEEDSDVNKEIYNEAKSSLYEESGQDYLMSNLERASCSVTGTEDINSNCHFHSESLKQTSHQNFPSIDASLNELNLVNFFDIIIVLSITGGTTALFFISYVLIDKCRREGPLIAKVNQLEKALLVSRKENVLLIEKCQSDAASTNLIDRAKATQKMLNLQAELQTSLAEQVIMQEQMQSLEKELENSTEVGLELNKMISDMLSSQNGNDVLGEHVEQLQNQLFAQHNDIAKYKESLNEKTTENHELQLELDINKKKVNDLQTEIDSMLLNVLKIEEERDENQQKFDHTLADLNGKLQQGSTEIQRVNKKLEKADKLNADVTRNFEMKSKELDLLKDSMKEVKAMKNNSETLKSLLDMSSVKAELHQLKTDNLNLNKCLQGEQQKTYTFEKQAEIAIQEAKLLKVRFDEADKDRTEAQTKLQVLGSYFKEKEGQLQKELSKHEALWNEKQGDASSTIERIKFMQEELQNYKSQNETFKHEIMSQEVELKSQISVLEKKSHEYWLNARQVDRKLEDAKQEAAQLRNRLTLQERTYMDDKSNGTMEHPLSPMHHMPGMGIVDHSDMGLMAGGEQSTASPPLLYSSAHREHMTASPHNLHTMPPPPPPHYLPHPPFMPPPPINGPPPPMFMHHGLPGMPLPPPPPLTQGSGGGMFGPPGDHRPPPLGRISSPPLPPDRTVGRRNHHRSSGGDCYSPSTVRTYSPPYDDRRTPPSPSYDDDDDDDLDEDDDELYHSGRGGGGVGGRDGHGNRYYMDNYREGTRQVESPPERQLNRSGVTKNGAKGSTISSSGSAHSSASADKGDSNVSAGQYHHHNSNV